MYYANSAQNMFILPGRLRIYVKGLNGNRKFADNIADYLSGIKGIKKVTANHYTGNVLVFFSEEYIHVSSIEKLIYDVRHKMDSADELVNKKSALSSFDYQIFRQPQIEKNIKRVYSKLIPVIILISSVYSFISGNLLMLLAAIIMIFPYMIYTSIFVTLKSIAGNAYLNGIKIKNRSVLAVTGNVDTIVFENTGLLTKGSCKVEDVISAGRFSENKILMLAASCGQKSDEPIAKALLQEAYFRNIELKQASHAMVFTDKGISSFIEGKEVFVGDITQLKNRNIFDNSYFNVDFAIERKLKYLGQYPVFVVYNSEIIGIIGFLFNMDENSIEAIEALRETGIEDIKIISDETEEIVENIAFEADIESFYANIQPESRAEELLELTRHGKVILLINKVNDCTTTKDPDIGIKVLCANVDTNSKDSDIRITNRDLRSIPELINFSKYAEEIIAQNCVISLGLDAIGIILLLTNSISYYTALIYKFISGMLVLLNARRPAKYILNS